MNKNWKIDSGAKSGCLGMAAIPFSESLGEEIHIGDEVVLYDHGEHLYNKMPEEEHWTPIW